MIMRSTKVMQASGN